MNKLFLEILAVAGGGAIGSVLRFLLSRIIQAIHHWQGFPLGILVVNILGCLLMGVLAGLLLSSSMISTGWRTFLLIGVLGGFTTFSSFSVDTVHLWQQGMYVMATTNVLLSVVGCLLATSLGFILAHAI